MLPYRRERRRGGVNAHGTGEMRKSRIDGDGQGSRVIDVRVGQHHMFDLRQFRAGKGEAETTADLAKSYVPRFALMIIALRNELQLPDVPVIVGALGPFLEKDKHPFAEEVNRQLQLIPAQIPHSAFVATDGLHDKGDKLHFDSASQRELGRRYATAFLTLKNVR